MNNLARRIGLFALGTALAALSSGCAMTAVSQWAANREISVNQTENRVLQAFVSDDALALKVSFEPLQQGHLLLSDSPIYWVRIPLKKDSGILFLDAVFHQTQTKFQRANPMVFDGVYREIEIVDLPRLPSKMEPLPDGAGYRKIKDFDKKLGKAKEKYKKTIKNSISSNQENIFIIDHVASDNEKIYSLLLCYKDESGRRRVLAIPLREPYDPPSLLEYAASAVLSPVALVEFSLCMIIMPPVLLLYLPATGEIPI